VKAALGGMERMMGSKPSGVPYDEVAENLRRWTADRLRFLADKIENYDVEFKGDPQWLSDDDSALLCSVIRSAAIMKDLP
jgi:hypothetical protein